LETRQCIRGFFEHSFGGLHFLTIVIKCIHNKKTDHWKMCLKVYAT